MINLPPNIEQLLDEMPIIPFDDNEEFQRVLSSDGFNEIFQFYSEHYSNDKIKTQSEIYQRISLYLTLTNQSERFIEQTDGILYNRPIPTIEEFLYNNFYMGYTSGTIYPYWREKLCTIFAPGSSIKKAVWTGCIGSGKSTIARKAVAYTLYRVLCLKYPRAIFNVDNDSTLASFIFSVTLKHVAETNLNPFISILESMPCFQKVLKINSFDNFDLTIPNSPIPFYIDKTNATIRFKNNIIQTVGSQITHQVGFNIFSAFLDEVAEKGITNGMEVINALDSRMSSRFQGSDYTFLSIVSSAKQKLSPIGEYIRTLPAYDKENIIMAPKLWEVKPDADFTGDGRVFTVLVGNGVVPSRIVDNEEELEQIEKGEFILQSGCEIINPPLIYKQKFEMNVDQAIQDIAGLATGGDEVVFKDVSKLIDESLTPEIHFTAELGSHADLITCLPESMFTVDLNGNKRLKRAPSETRYCHFDLAHGSEAEAGISLLHKELYENPETLQNEVYYVFDFIGWVTAKNRLDLEAIFNLYKTLVVDYGVVIEYMTTDIHQGELMKQMFDNSKLAKKTGYLSVDRKLNPYMNMASYMELGRVKIGRCKYLLEQMDALVIKNNKVEMTTRRKDLCDSAVGSVEAARIMGDKMPGFNYIPYNKNNPLKKEVDYLSFISDDEVLQEL